MSGRFYCNGKKEECKDSCECYMNGGNCHCTNEIDYAADKKPEFKIHKESKPIHEEYRAVREGSTSEYIVPAVVSVIAAFVTNLIIILAKML